MEKFVHFKKIHRKRVNTSNVIHWESFQVFNKHLAKKSFKKPFL